MEAEFWRGNLVRLRAVEPEDWENFQAWDLDTQTARECYFIPFPRSSEEARSWSTGQALQPPQGDCFRWAIENLSGEMVGNINSHHCEPRNGTFEYGLAIAREHRRKGYAREAIQIVLRYFFEELRYQKVTVQVYAFNEASLKLHESLGFRQEGHLRRMVYTAGDYHDLVVFGMTAEEFAEGLGKE